MKGVSVLSLWLHGGQGKDLLCWNMAIQRCIEKPIIAWYIAPTQAQCRRIIWENKTHEGTSFMDCIPKELIKKIDETSKIVYFINGSTLWLCSADSDSLVGSNPSLIVFSEYALMSKDPLPLLLPIVQANGGTLIFNTTPRGINFFYKLYTQALDNPEWKVFKHIITDLNVYTPEQIQAMKDETTESMWEQEFLCQFNSNTASVFRNIERCISPIPLNTPQAREYYKVKPHERYSMGVDLAKSKDFTVLTNVNMHSVPYKVYPQTAFNKIDYSFQKAKIEAEYHKYNQPNLLIDQSGVGAPIVEDLKKVIRNAEGMIFTQRSREDLLNNLAMHLENETIEIPNDPELIKQLNGFQYVFDPIRNTTKMKSIIDHDDYVMSTALAIFNLPTKPKAYVNKDHENILKQYDYNRKLKEQKSFGTKSKYR